MEQKITYKGKTYTMLYKLIKDHPNFNDKDEEKVIIETTMKSIINEINELAKRKAHDMIDAIQDSLYEQL